MDFISFIYFLLISLVGYYHYHSIIYVPISAMDLLLTRYYQNFIFYFSCYFYSKDLLAYQVFFEFFILVYSFFSFLVLIRSVIYYYFIRRLLVFLELTCNFLPVILFFHGIKLLLFTSILFFILIMWTLKEFLISEH